MSFKPEDYRFMARAIQLAKKGLFTTHPNPRVGCVIVEKGEINRRKVITKKQVNRMLKLMRFYDYTPLSLHKVRLHMSR